MLNAVFLNSTKTNKISHSDNMKTIYFLRIWRENSNNAQPGRAEQGEGSLKITDFQNKTFPVGLHVKY